MKILCIIVIYNQPLFDTVSYKTCGIDKADGKVGLFVYDNSPVPQHDTRDLDIIGCGIHYVSDISNPGVSAAYNRGVEYAVENGYDWVLLMDQDTDFCGDYVSRCQAEIAARPDCPLFAPVVVDNGNNILSPVKLRWRFPLRGRQMPAGENVLDDVAIINSGICVKVEAFQKVGGYNEKVFLDYSDHQFIERLSKKYEDFYLIDYVIRQDFSNFETDKNKLASRFTLFCRSLSGYEKQSLSDYLSINLIVIKRSLSLCMRTRSLRFLKILFREYYLQ